MKCRKNASKSLTIFLLGFFVIGFSISSIDGIFEPLRYDLSSINSCFVSEPVLTKPSSTIQALAQNQTSSPLAYLFQLLFILFIISPPLIVFMLYLIWKELKKRNELK